MTNFKRTHKFRLEDGTEVTVKMSEHVWQKRILPYMDDISGGVEIAYKQTLMDALGIEEVDTELLHEPKTGKEYAAVAFLTLWKAQTAESGNTKSVERLRKAMLWAAKNLAVYTGGDGVGTDPKHVTPKGPGYWRLGHAYADARKIVEEAKKLNRDQ